MIRLEHVTKRYRSEAGDVLALQDLSLELPARAFAAVTGPSGCGKSTLLHLAGCLDTPSEGEIYAQGRALSRLSEKEKTRFRREEVGIVFQFFNLMPTMTVEENVSLPLLLAGRPVAEARERSRSLLHQVGLPHRRRHFAHQLSGGEMQRTAIARALVHAPKLLLADEPTGNLDSKNAEHILALLREVHQSRALTVILVTHSASVAAAAAFEVRLRDGRLEALERRPASAAREPDKMPLPS